MDLINKAEFCLEDFYNPEKNLFDCSYEKLLKIATEFFMSIWPEKINEKKLENLIQKIYSKYRINPYHNFAHGLQITQMFFYFVTHHKNADFYVNEEDIFINCLACLAHDNRHPGTNNDFQIQSQNKLSIKT